MLEKLGGILAYQGGLFFWKIEMANDFLLTTVEGCARCGGVHRDMEFKAFKFYPAEAGGVTWNYWAMCPEAKEPVLMRFESANESMAESA